jgi:flagellar hook assembly protein FlgD
LTASTLVLGDGLRDASGGAADDPAEAARADSGMRFVRFQVDFPSAGHHCVTITNLSGEFIQLLADEPLPSGQVAFRWDGCDDHGHAQPTGLYLAWVDDTRAGMLGLVR